MTGSTPQLPRRESDAQPPNNPDPDSDSASATRRTGGSRRKRTRSNDDEPPATANAAAAAAVAACDQCRLRKVRCDRRQPDCSNCRKSGVVCSSSYTLKRVNHTKQLRGDISVVLERLDHIDTTLAALTKPHQAATQPWGEHKAEAPSSNDQVPLLLPEFDFDQLSDAPALSDHPPSDDAAFEIVELDEGGKRIYGYPAPFVLLKALQRQAARALVLSDEQSEHHGNGRETSTMTRALQVPHVRAALRAKLEEFPFRSPRSEPAMVGDTNPISTPSRLLCNLFIEGYLKHINSRTPIFDDAELRSAIEAHYNEEESKENSAWALIINNVVLLEFGLEIRAARASQPNSRGMNDDILPSFLKNCDRAIESLHTFTTPSLVNIQALMTLTLVARDFYSLVVTQKVCHAACEAGRMFGLHRSIAQFSRGSSTSDSSDAVRQRIFRVLYTMDKQRVFMTGLPCDLHMFDSDYPPFNDAFGHLANLWEDIYLSLYTSRAARAREEARATQVVRLSNSLDRYCLKYIKSLPTTPDNSDENYPVKMELVYGFHVSQVLVLRCERRNTKSQEKMRELGRTSLKLILAVCKPPHTAPQLALLANITGNYPMVAFFELVSYYMAGLLKTGEVDEQMQADIALLRDVCKHLQIPEHEKLTHIFYTRLKLGLKWALGLLEVLTEALTSAALNQDGESQHSRASSTNSSQNPSSLEMPELFHICPIRLPTVDGGNSKLSSSRSGETSEFSSIELAERTDFGLLSLMGTDLMNLGSMPASSSCDFNRTPPSVMALSQAELASHIGTGNADWDNSNMDYLQGAFGQGPGWS